MASMLMMYCRLARNDRDDRKNDRDDRKNDRDDRKNDRNDLYYE